MLIHTAVCYTAIQPAGIVTIQTEKEKQELSPSQKLTCLEDPVKMHKRTT